MREVHGQLGGHVAAREGRGDRLVQGQRQPRLGGQLAQGAGRGQGERADPGAAQRGQVPADAEPGAEVAGQRPHVGAR